MGVGRRYTLALAAHAMAPTTRPWAGPSSHAMAPGVALSAAPCHICSTPVAP